MTQLARDHVTGELFDVDEARVVLRAAMASSDRLTARAAMKAALARYRSRHVCEREEDHAGATDPKGVARLLAMLAQDFDERQAVQVAGALRQGARLLVECRCREPAPNECQGCGRPLPQPSGRGRPRKYCSESCRRRAEKMRGNAMVVA